MYLTPLSIGSGYSVVTGASQIHSGPNPDHLWHFGPDPDQVRNSGPYRPHCKLWAKQIGIMDTGAWW